MLAACFDDNVSLVKELIEQNTTIEECDKISRSRPIHVATLKNNVEIASLLMGAKCDVNCENRGGETPLHIACWVDSIQIAKLLLINGANVNCVDFNGESPLHIASRSISLQMCELLVRFGANVDLISKENKSPVQICTSKEIQLFLSRFSSGGFSSGGSSLTTSQNDETTALLDRIEELTAQNERLKMELEQSRIRSIKIHPDKIKNLNLDNPVYQGHRCNIFRATWCRIDVVVKKSSSGARTGRNDVLLLDSRLKTREIKRLTTIRHPNIISFFGVVEDAIVLEFASGGSLECVLSKTPILNRMSVFSITIQFVTALAFLHSQTAPITHKNICAKHVVFSSPFTPHDEPLVKIIDFSSSQSFDLSSTTQSVHSMGDDLTTVAPETIGHENFMETVVGAIDVYQSSLLFWRLLSGKKPYDGERPMNLLTRLPLADTSPARMRPSLTCLLVNVPTDIYSKITTLLHSAWCSNPKNRITTLDFLERLNEMVPFLLRDNSVILPQLDSFSRSSSSVTKLTPGDACDWLSLDPSDPPLNTLLSNHLHFDSTVHKIKKAYAVHNQVLMQRFLAQHITMQRQHVTSPAIFKGDDWRRVDGGFSSSLEQVEWREWIMKHFEETFSKYGRRMHSNPIAMIKGVGTFDDAKLKCENGFVVSGKSEDEGYFGKGIYGTTFFDYALRYTAKTGDRVLVIFWGLLGNPMPIVEKPSLERGVKTFYGKPLRLAWGYQSHVTRVRIDGWDKCNSWVPARPDDNVKIFDEIVVPDGSHLIPRYVIVLE